MLSNHLFSSFTKKYQLSKTLRFELKPVEETKSFLNNFIQKDDERDQDYKELKKIIDEYHKYYIQTSLEKKDILNVQDLDRLHHMLGNKDQSTEIKNLQKKLRKQITSCFNKKEHLFDKKLITELIPQWLDDCNTENKDHKKKIVSKFEKFTTYLTNFHKNRKNMYSEKDQSTAISYRVINENFQKFSQNLKVYSTILKDHPKLNDKIKKIKNNLLEEFDYFNIKNIEDLFRVKFFNQCISQCGIDRYNTIIGGKSLKDGNKIQGINEMINLYQQSEKIKNKNLPKLQILYKQILSDKESHSFILESFENNKDLLEFIEKFYHFLKEKSSLTNLKNLFESFNSKDYDLSKIYYSKIKLNNLSSEIFKDYRYILSSEMFKDYRYILSALEYYSEVCLKTKKDREEFLNTPFFNLQQIQDALQLYTKHLSNGEHSKTEVIEEISTYISDHIRQYISNVEMDKLFGNFKQSTKDYSNQFDEEQIDHIKKLLDSIKEILWMIQPIYLQKDGKRIHDLPMDLSFYDQFNKIYEDILPINNLYNKCRNYIASNKNHLKKYKINFEDSTLLNGWDLNKESDNLSIILRKKNAQNQWNYYLGVMDKDHRKLFDYHIGLDCSEKQKSKKDELKKLITPIEDQEYYEKMNYKQISSAAQDIQNLMIINGKVSRKTKNLDEFKKKHFPSEIWKIKDRNSYKKGAKFNKKDLSKFINFYQEIAKKYWKEFDLKFKPCKDYQNFTDFTNHIDTQGYQLSFDCVREEYVNERVKNGELYLFQIYNKDFSKYSKGSPNLHTMFFKFLFDKENLQNIVYKLNGRSEIFYRKAFKEVRVVHPKNQLIKNKNHKSPKKSSLFPYDIVKDKRFTEDKFFLHIPITLNFKHRNMTNSQFNQNVLKFLKNNKDVNIIGIDRGEKHLAYYTVIDQSGSILEQNSFNIINSTYNNKDKKIEVKTDFHKLLTNKEQNRDQERKEWKNIENIKELKSGYISHLVHQISKLMLKHNAIVVFEYLNFGFKRGRMKFEKQIYQKLEKALIDKLNYLTFKNTNSNSDPGGFLNAYQLTAPFESFQKMGKQTGFMFYVPAHYTSKVCPLTGFTSLIYPKYENIKKSQEFFKKFEDIYYNKKGDYFVFKYQDNKVNSKRKSESSRIWEVCTHGQERFTWNYKTKQNEKINITQEIKNLFGEHQIEYMDGSSLLEQIYSQEEKEFFIKIMKYLRVVLQLRYFNKEANKEQDKDFILSPVKDRYGRFFDSRKVKDNSLPKDSDANGAYHIALKGLLSLQKLNNSTECKISNLKNTDWFSFIQNRGKESNKNKVSKKVA